MKQYCVQLTFDPSCVGLLSYVINRLQSREVQFSFSNVFLPGFRLVKFTTDPFLDCFPQHSANPTILIAMLCFIKWKYSRNKQIRWEYCNDQVLQIIFLLLFPKPPTSLYSSGFKDFTQCLMTTKRKRASACSAQLSFTFSGEDRNRDKHH